MNIINIYLRQLKASKIFISLFSISIILNLIFNVGFFFINSNYYSIMFYLIATLFLLMVIRILILTIHICSNNLRNNLDFDFITRSVTKNKIFWSKYQVILIMELIAILSNSLLYLIPTAILNNNGNEILTLFLITFFGEFLLSLFFIPLFLLIAYRLKYLKGIMLMLFLAIIVPLISLTSHLFLCENNNSLKYNQSQKYQYQKFSKLDQNYNVLENYIGIKNNYYLQDYKENTNSNFYSSITNVNIGVNFILTDWFLSPFYTIAKNHLKYENDFLKIANLNDNGFSGSLIRFKLPQYKLIDENNKDNYINLNVNDVSIFELNSNDLKKEISKTINNILDSQITINLKDVNEINFLYSKIQSNSIWIKNNFTDKEINTILYLRGLKNDDANVLHYVYQYIDYVLNFLPDISEYITSISSSEFWQLLLYLHTNTNAKWNMEVYESFISKNEILNKFPSVYVSDNFAAPKLSDIDFLKNNYLLFNSIDQVRILQKSGAYVNYPLTQLSAIGINNVNSQESWITYVNNNITTLADYSYVCDSIKSIDTNNIYEIIPSLNVFDINSYSYFSKPISIGWIEFSDILLGLYFFVFPIMNYISWKYSKSKDFK